MFWRATNGNFAANFRAHPKAETIAALPRVSPVAVRPGEGPFTERTTDIQAVRRERVLIPFPAVRYAARIPAQKIESRPSVPVG